MNSPQSAETDYFSEVSSCPGSLSPVPLGYVEPLRNSDDLNFGSEDDFNFSNGNIDNVPPLL
jgi:hypothetical protein